MNLISTVRKYLDVYQILHILSKQNIKGVGIVVRFGYFEGLKSDLEWDLNYNKLRKSKFERIASYATHIMPQKWHEDFSVY